MKKVIGQSKHSRKSPDSGTTNLPLDKWIEVHGLPRSERNFHRWAAATVQGAIDRGRFQWLSEPTGGSEAFPTFEEIQQLVIDATVADWLVDNRELTPSQKKLLRSMRRRFDKMVAEGLFNSTQKANTGWRESAPLDLRKRCCEQVWIFHRVTGVLIAPVTCVDGIAG